MILFFGGPVDKLLKKLHCYSVRLLQKLVDLESVSEREQ